MTGRANRKYKDPRAGRDWVFLEQKGGQPDQNNDSKRDSGVRDLSRGITEERGRQRFLKAPGHAEVGAGRSLQLALESPSWPLTSSPANPTGPGTQGNMPGAELPGALGGHARWCGGFGAKV